MSLNFLSERFLSCEDDEFVLKVDKDIREYLSNSLTNSVLIFPPVNNYRRFLIHKVSEAVKNELSPNCELATFSIGVENQRRTVVCRKQQLLINPATTAKTERSKENEFAWHYLKRNSVPKTYNHSEQRRYQEPSSGNRIMGIEYTDVTTASAKKNITNNCSNVEESNIDCSSFSDDQLSAKKSSRTRRPDKAVYIPRAKRSQTTPPSSSINSNSSSVKSHRKKSDKLKSKSIDESHSSNSETQEEGELSSPDCHPVIIPQFNTNLNSCDLSSSHRCEDSPTDTKNLKNYQNLCTMSQQQAGTDLLIENSACAITPTDKVDKDEKELIKASQEINRSNRKLIKQSFNSNVLEIESSEGAASKNDKNEEAVNEEEDDWDTLFNDNGDCLDPKMVDELTKAVGKVSIEKPKSDYKTYHTNVDLLRNEGFPHVLECSNFPVEFRTQDLMALFATYAKESGFDIKWVDDTHCLVVFSSQKVAAEVLSANHPIVKLKPLSEASAESRTKARKCSSSLQPYRQRPETCAALAKRLVSGALGVRIKATSEERETERRVLREAKERKLLAAKNRQEREDAWNN